MEFKSEKFENFDDMLAERVRVVTSPSAVKKRTRRELVRKFTNGLATMTEEDAKRLGRSEITNHLFTYRNIVLRVARLLSTYTLTTRFVEVETNTGNAEDDFIMSEEITTALNEGIFYHGTRFMNLLWTTCGELQISGGVPFVRRSPNAVLPDIEHCMHFPLSTGTEPDEVPYAFSSREVSYADLVALKKKASGEVVDMDAVEACIDYIKSKSNGKGVASSTSDIKEPVASDLSWQRESGVSPVVSDRTTPSGGVRAAFKSLGTTVSTDEAPTITFWTFHEVLENGKVAMTVFTLDGIDKDKIEQDSNTTCATIIAHYPEAFDSSEMWLHNFVVDSEVGGERKLIDVRGVAEIVYPSSAELEELINLMLEGDKMRAKPRFQMGDDYDPDKILGWNPVRSSLVPKGVLPFDMRTSTSQLQVPIQMLQQNTGNLTGGDVANGPVRGGELRQQAIERQGNSGLLQTNDLNVFYNNMDCLLAHIVEQVFTVTPSKCAVREKKMVEWVRWKLESKGIPYDKLAEKKHGRFVAMKVRCNRIIGDGDTANMDEIAEWLVDNSGRFAPAIRPMLLQRSVAIKTKNPDLARQLVATPSVIINSQKVVAENEADTIARRSDLGQILPINPDDVHLDHLPVHFTDMAALVARSQSRKWDRSDVLTFAGLQEHTQLHLRAALEDPASAPEAQSMLQDFQEIVSMGQRLAAEVEKEQGSESAKLTAKEQADLEIKMAELELKGQQFGHKVKSDMALERSREARNALQSRKAYFNELVTMDRLRNEKAKLNDELRQSGLDATADSQAANGRTARSGGATQKQKPSSTGS